MYYEEKANSHRPRYGTIQDDERLSAEEMDERRRQNIAYEYLCHLEEAKRLFLRALSVPCLILNHFLSSV
uniref:Uncharacterized protein n=1 Tax=Hucho hucho TaxID=62062 RepID=A0A4W5L386_9TELE